MKNQTAGENVSLIFPPIYHPLPCGSRLSAQLLGKWCLLSPSSLIKMMDPANLSSRFQIQFLFAGSLSQWYVTYLIYEIIAQINGTKLFFKLQSTVFSVIQLMNSSNSCLVINSSRNLAWFIKNVGCVVIYMVYVYSKKKGNQGQRMALL